MEQWKWRQRHGIARIEFSGALRGGSRETRLRWHWAFPSKQTTSYVFKSAEHAANLFGLKDWECTVLPDTVRLALRALLARVEVLEQGAARGSEITLAPQASDRVDWGARILRSGEKCPMHHAMILRESGRLGVAQNGSYGRADDPSSKAALAARTVLQWASTVSWRD